MPCFLAVIQDRWKSQEPSQNVLAYGSGFRQRLYAAGNLAMENMGEKNKKNIYLTRKLNNTRFPAIQFYVYGVIWTKGFWSLFCC